MYRQYCSTLSRLTPYLSILVKRFVFLFISLHCYMMFCDGDPRYLRWRNMSCYPLSKQYEEYDYETALSTIHCHDLISKVTAQSSKCNVFQAMLTNNSPSQLVIHDVPQAGYSDTLITREPSLGLCREHF